MPSLPRMSSGKTTVVRVNGGKRRRRRSSNTAAQTVNEGRGRAERRQGRVGGSGGPAPFGRPLGRVAGPAREPAAGVPGGGGMGCWRGEAECGLSAVAAIGARQALPAPRRSGDRRARPAPETGSSQPGLGRARRAREGANRSTRKRLTRGDRSPAWDRKCAPAERCSPRGWAVGAEISRKESPYATQMGLRGNY